MNRLHFLSLFVFVSLLFIVSCNEKEKGIEVQSIAISQPSVEMEIGETLSLKATVSPSNATYDVMAWTSTNPNVASVSGDGLVSALSEGNTTITVKAGGKTASCSISVVKGFVAVSSISLSKTSLEIIEGDTETLTASVFPDDATDKTVIWISSNDAVAIVKDGVVSAVTAGEATITAKAGEKSATCAVTVSRKPAPEGNIEFVDGAVKEICVKNWDTDGDGELSFKEAAEVKTLNKAFYNNRVITSFDEFQYFTGIQSINFRCFGNSTKLQRISIPKFLESIEACSFACCTSLYSIEVPESKYFRSVEGVLFNADMTELICYPPKKEGTSYVVPETVTTIYDCAFLSCELLESITLHDGITNMDGSFGFCTSLKSITIPRGVSRIGEFTFDDCSSLSEVVFQGSIESIEQQAFFNCTSLKEITLPEGLKTIQSQAFLGCYSLTSLVFPSSLSTIGEDAFSSCSNLEEIVLPQNVTILGRGVFRDCANLTRVTLNEGLTSIGDSAFSNCPMLYSICFPNSLTSIGASAFWKCTKLKSITVLPTVPPTGSLYMFDDTNNCPIYVPIESVETYKTIQYWSEYANRIRAFPSDTDPVQGAVDLGLSVLWATCNLGASSPEEYGDYYAWGETEPYYSSLDPLIWKEGKEGGYAWPSYKWCMGKQDSITKYCNDYDSEYYGYNGFTDAKTVLDSEDDAAHVNLGGKWRMPTDAEWDALINNCTWTWVTQNGVNGRLVTASNGNSIFLPAASYWTGYNNIGNGGSAGGYWSSSLYIGYSSGAKAMLFDSQNVNWGGHGRCYGLSVRPVYPE